MGCGVTFSGEKRGLTVYFKASAPLGYKISPIAQTLTLGKSQEWNVTGSIIVNSVFGADIDSDGTQEILTGGQTWNGSSHNAQLRIWSWNSSTLTLEKSQEWDTTSASYSEVSSVFAADVDGDGKKEIVTGGNTQNLTGSLPYPLNLRHAQLRIWKWDGTALTLKKSEQWVTTYTTSLNSVFVADVDADGRQEILTGSSESGAGKTPY